MLRLWNRSSAAGHNSMTSVDTPRAACLGSTRRIRETPVFPVRSARDQSVVRRYPCGSTCPFPPLKRDEGGIAREVGQAQ